MYIALPGFQKKKARNLQQALAKKPTCESCKGFLSIRNRKGKLTGQRHGG
jgi:hypothetical protein